MLYFSNHLGYKRKIEFDNENKNYAKVEVRGPLYSLISSKTTSNKANIYGKTRCVVYSVQMLKNVP